MKKLKFICLSFITMFLLFLNFAFFSPTKVFAITFDDVGDAEDWFIYISDFSGGLAYCEVGEPIFETEIIKLPITIIKESSDKLNGYIFEYIVWFLDDDEWVDYKEINYFEPRLNEAIDFLISFGGDFGDAIEAELGETNFDGYLYWNFAENYWQIDNTELEYYRQRVEELESLVDDLNNQIDVLNNQMDLEYNRGYDDGYDAGYDAGSGGYDLGYQDGFIDGEKSKLAKNNESFYNNIVIWVPAVITVVALASIISIFGIKKKE